MFANHPLIAAARANLRAADYDIRAAGLWTNPQLNTQYAHALTYNSYASFGYAQLGISQFVEAANVPGARAHVAQGQRTVTRAENDGQLQTLASDVAAAFVLLATAHARSRILTETVAQMARADRIVRARVDAGAAPRYDASRIVLASAGERSQLGESDADVVSALGALQVAVGPAAASLQGTPAMDVYSVPDVPPLTALIDLTHSSRPELVAARGRLEVANGQVSVTRRSVLPGVSLFAGAGVGAAADPMSGTPQMDSRRWARRCPFRSSTAARARSPPRARVPTPSRAS